MRSAIPEPTLRLASTLRPERPVRTLLRIDSGVSLGEPRRRFLGHSRLYFERPVLPRLSGSRCATFFAVDVDARLRVSLSLSDERRLGIYHRGDRS
jgi:hypothetical protein